MAFGTQADTPPDLVIQQLLGLFEDVGHMPDLAPYSLWDTDLAALRSFSYGRNTAPDGGDKPGKSR